MKKLLMQMKMFLIAIAVCCVAVGAGSLGWNLRADEITLTPLQPDVFLQWKTKKILTSQSVVWMVMTNPDTVSTIRAVAVAVAPQDMTVVGYKYFENGRPRSFVYSVEKEKFNEIELTSEQIEQCLECHKYGRFVSEVSPGDAS